MAHHGDGHEALSRGGIVPVDAVQKDHIVDRRFVTRALAIEDEQRVADGRLARGGVVEARGPAAFDGGFQVRGAHAAAENRAGGGLVGGHDNCRRGEDVAVSERYPAWRYGLDRAIQADRAYSRGRWVGGTISRQRGGVKTGREGVHSNGRVPDETEDGASPHHHHHHHHSSSLVSKLISFFFIARYLA